jgi:hypothetical protein
MLASEKILSLHEKVQNNGIENDGFNISDAHNLLVKQGKLEHKLLCCLLPIKKELVAANVRLLPKKIKSQLSDLVVKFSLDSESAKLYFQNDTNTFERWAITMLILDSFIAKKKLKKIVGDYEVLAISSYKLALLTYIANPGHYALGNLFLRLSHLTKYIFDDLEINLLLTTYTSYFNLLEEQQS